MKRRRLYILALVGLAAVMAWVLHYGLEVREPALDGHGLVDRPPGIRPDYCDIVIPPNIAPMNFVIEEPGSLYHVKIRSAQGEPIAITSRSPRIEIPLRAWKKLLNDNRGEKLSLDVYVRAADGGWNRFETVANTVAREEIDPYVTYRLINSVFSMWETMSIRQRSLEDFDESLILDSGSLDVACLHCHAFLSRRPDRMILQMRHTPDGYGSGMVLVQDSRVTKVDTRTARSLRLAGIPSWHPSGRAIAFSINRFTQFFHGTALEVRDVVDLDSDMAIYLLDSQTVTSTRDITEPDVLETWPEWSPDGRYLYYCTAPLTWQDRYNTPPEGYEQVRYALKRIGYDIDTGAWGKPEDVLSPQETGLSITQPRISPDGRFLLFAMCDYSSFPSFRPDSDLYLLDLESRQHRRLECSSDRSESWHCWSSNGRWIAFSSKRDDGVLLRVYFSYIDEDGIAHKPFILPQKDPTFYDSFIQMHQMPELVSGPIPLKGEDIARRLRSDEWVGSSLPVTAATPAPVLQPGEPSARQRVLEVPQPMH